MNHRPPTLTKCNAQATSVKLEPSRGKSLHECRLNDVYAYQRLIYKGFARRFCAAPLANPEYLGRGSALLRLPAAQGSFQACIAGSNARAIIEIELCGRRRETPSNPGLPADEPAMSQM